jgi:hypothetical protein
LEITQSLEVEGRDRNGHGDTIVTRVEVRKRIEYKAPEISCTSVLLSPGYAATALALQP